MYECNAYSVQIKHEFMLLVKGDRTILSARGRERGLRILTSVSYIHLYELYSMS